jgi:hypothetical protein
MSYLNLILIKHLSKDYVIMLLSYYVITNSKYY